MIRFIIVVILVILFLICSIPLMTVAYILEKSNPKAHQKFSKAIVSWAFRTVIFLSGVKVTVLGAKNVPKDTPVLYVGNHRSYFDILLTYVRVPMPTGYVSKMEMGKVPLLNIWMQHIGCLFLDRDDLRQGMKTIQKGAEMIKSGYSMYIFPEGTRSREKDKFLPFHGGSFKMADKAGCPIIPVALCNTGAIFEDHFPKIRPAHIIIEYLPPVYMDRMDRAEKKQVDGLVKDLLEKTCQKNLINDTSSV